MFFRVSCRAHTHVKHHVIETAKHLLQLQAPGTVDADSVVKSILQGQPISTDVLYRYQVEARLVAQEYLDQKRPGSEASAQDHVLSQSAEVIEACSQEGDFLLTDVRAHVFLYLFLKCWSSFLFIFCFVLVCYCCSRSCKVS